MGLVRFFQLLEYFCLTCLVVVILGKEVKVKDIAIPLTATLTLNAINRTTLNGKLQNELKNQLEETEETFKLTLTEIDEKVQSLPDQLQTLSNKIESVENSISTLLPSSEIIRINTISEQIKNELYVYLDQQIERINNIFKETRPELELVFDRQGSRNILLEALKIGQKHIILVCPWITKYGADNEVMGLCQKFLDKGGKLEIGWGHLSDTSWQNHKPVSKEDFFKEVAASNNNRSGKNVNFWYKTGLDKFEELKLKYPNQIELKLLGTHEKFLVCDRSFVVIGSHNFLTSNPKSPERELGVLIKDKNIIDHCIKRFENEPSLDNSESLGNRSNSGYKFNFSGLENVRKLL